MFIITTKFPTIFGADAITIAPFIFITAEFRNNSALIEHETVHYKEQFKWLVLPWWVAYLVSSKFRLNAEVRAYKKQISVNGITVEQAAQYISSKYMLNISYENAEELLRT